MVYEYDPFSLCVIHKDGMCPSTGDSNRLIHTYTYHSRFIPEGVAEKSQIFFRNQTFNQNTADVTGGKPSAVWSQSISGVSVNNPFTTSMEQRERCYSFILCLTPHENRLMMIFIIKHTHTHPHSYNPQFEIEILQ
jgi:hypothetical protein